MVLSAREALSSVMWKTRTCQFGRKLKQLTEFVLESPRPKVPGSSQAVTAQSVAHKGSLAPGLTI